MLQPVRRHADTDTTLRTFVSSSPITFPTGIAGGLGRKGSQKVIIFETDGLPNTTATASLVTAGSYKYYKIRYDMNPPMGANTHRSARMDDQRFDGAEPDHIRSSSNWRAPTDPEESVQAVRHRFGPVFQGTDSAWAQQTLQTMQYYAGTQTSASTPLASNQIITGTDAQMSANMVAAFTNILQSGVQVALIK